MKNISRSKAKLGKPIVKKVANNNVGQKAAPSSKKPAQTKKTGGGRYMS